MKYEYWFSNLKGISGKRKKEIREKFPTTEALYNIEETALKRNNIEEGEYKIIVESLRNWKLEEEYDAMIQKGIQCVTIFDACYPERLKNISSAPYALYVKGKLPEENSPTVAIVGARECSAYGQTMASEFAATLAKEGVQIISGMARGVDSASQESALEAGGTSFGVLGCGVDICYPKEKISLYMRLQERGGLLSELPPGTPPQKCYFPARNRIISGLADAVLVMEAKPGSGSLITVDMALEQGKDVYALPGPVGSLLSRGCNELIRQGAGILLSPQDLMEELQIASSKEEKKSGTKKILLETEENIVYSCLDFYPRNLEELIQTTGLDISQLMAALMSLELKGFIAEISKNYYVKAK